MPSCFKSTEGLRDKKKESLSFEANHPSIKTSGFQINHYICGMKIRPDIHFFSQLHRAWAPLIDPDRISFSALPKQIEQFVQQGAACILVGGSHLATDHVTKTIQLIKRVTQLPVVLFPGPGMSLSSEADGLLFLSLLSGRNAELIIGQQVQTAYRVAQSGLDVLGTAYLLVDGGKMTTAHYVSQTMPLPSDKPELAASTALAAKFMGFPICFLDAGSGASQPVPANLIRAVRDAHGGPLLVGGGIRSRAAMEQAWNAGANLLVVGTLFEEQNPELNAWPLT
jgi:phosphoglycerol geranylgeranyltransferase